MLPGEVPPGVLVDMCPGSEGGHGFFAELLLPGNALQLVLWVVMTHWTVLSSSALASMWVSTQACSILSLLLLLLLVLMVLLAVMLLPAAIVLSSTVLTCRAWVCGELMKALRGGSAIPSVLLLDAIGS